MKSPFLNKSGVAQFRKETPIATEMFIPNHSGILGSEQAKADLDARYLINYNQTQPSRALNTVYQNTSGRPLVVYGSMNVTWTDPNFPGETAYFTCLTGSANPPTTIRGKGGTVITYNTIAVPNMAAQQEFNYYFIVPTNHYYEITSTTSGFGAVAITAWNEVASPPVPT